MYDPMNPLGGSSPFPRQPVTLTPEEEQSILGQIGDVSLSGLSVVGNILDVPSSMVRDVLAWQNPIDQLASPWSAQNRTTGRELVRQHGLIGPEDTTANWWGGLASEILLDPLTYMTFGGSAALTGAGKAASKAGMLAGKMGRATLKRVGTAAAKKSGSLADEAAELGARAARLHATPQAFADDAFEQAMKQSTAADDVARRAEAQVARDDILSKFAPEQLNEPIGGLVGLGLPFMDNSVTIGKAGGMGERIAKRLDDPLSLIDRVPGVGPAARYVEEKAINPLMENVRGLMDARVMGVTKGALQDDMVEGFEAADEASRAGRASIREIAQRYNNYAVQKFGDTPEGMIESSDALREAVERRNDALWRMGADPEMKKFADEIGGRLDAIKEKMMAMGFKERELNDLIDFFPRRVGEHVLAKGRGNANKAIMDLMDPSALEREAAYKGWVRGTRGVKEMYMDPQFHNIMDTSATKGEAKTRLRGALNERYNKPMSGVPEVYWTKGDKTYIDPEEVKEDFVKWVLSNQPKNSSDQFLSQARQAAESTPFEQIVSSKGFGLKSHDHNVPEVLPTYWKDGNKTYIDPKDVAAEWARRSVDELEEGASAWTNGSKVYSADEVAEEWAEGTVREMMDAGDISDDAVDMEEAFNAAYDDAMTDIPATADALGLTPTVDKSLQASTFKAAYEDALTDIDATAAAMGFKPHDRYAELAEKLISHQEARQYGLFTNDAAWDLAEAIATSEQQAELANTVYSILAKHATAEFSGNWLTKNAEGTRLRTILRNLGKGVLDVNRAEQLVFRRLPQEVRDGVARNAYKSATGDELVGSIDDAIASLDGNATKAFNKKFSEGMGDIRVPKDIADQMTKLWPAFKVPEPVSFAEEHLAALNNLFKAGVLTWPARFVRDRVSGFLRNVEAGMTNFDAEKKAWAFMRGDVVDFTQNPAARQWMDQRGLQHTPVNSTTAMRALYDQYGPQGWREHTDVSGANFAAAEQEATRNALLEPEKYMPGVPQTKEAFASGSWNPLDVRGVYGRGKSDFKLAKAGDVIGSKLDTGNRMAPFLYLTGKGVDPAEAMRRVDFAQVSYDPKRYTVFERRVLKQAMPFYSFVSRQLPYVANELLTRPGGRMAQTIRATEKARGEDAGVPDYVAETMSIPLGEGEDGSKRYLAGIGLMHESPLAFLGGGARGGLTELLAQTTPAIKAPIEWAAGESFFQRGPRGGRELEDMDPTIGRTFSNIHGLVTGEDVKEPYRILGGKRASQGAEFLLGNSPLSRLLTTVRTATDKRKYDNFGLPLVANLLTGARVSDVSEAAQSGVAREKAQELALLEGGRAFENIYIPKELIESLPEGSERRRKLEVLQAWINQKKREAKQRAKKKAAK